MLFTPPQLRSSAREPLQPNPQQQKPGPCTRRRQTKFICKQLAFLTAFVLLLLGCTQPGVLSISSQASIRLNGTERGEQRTNHAIVAPPHPFSQPNPSSTPEPTATPSPTIVDTPTSTPTPSPTATNRPLVTPTPILSATLQSQINYVVIISIDGLRPDALEFADTPTLDDLRAGGAYSPNAQTIKISVTLPSHASMLGGMIPEKHGILWGLPYIGWPGMNGPTLFSVAHEAGLSTAVVFGKQKLNYLILPNSVDQVFSDDVHDMEIKEQAIEFIEAGLPDVLFIHFPDTDRVGHAHGWMSAHQFQAITYVDGLIGEIVTALKTGGYLDNTLLIVTSDHGGHGKMHGDDSPVDRTIPWLTVGPGVPSGITLTTKIDTYDTAATALYALKLPIPENWDGQPILEIFD